MAHGWRKRLKDIIDDTPGLNMKALSLKAGLSATAVYDWLKRDQSPTIDNFLAVCDAAGVHASEIIDGGEPHRLRLPVVGIVSAGEGWIPVDPPPLRGAADTIDFEIGDHDVVVVQIRGDSMSPVYRNGDSLVCHRRSGRGAHNLIGRDCVVLTHPRCGRDQAGYVKILAKGSRSRLYNLRSYNPTYPDIEDVSLAWVAPVAWVRRNPG